MNITPIPTPNKSKIERKAGSYSMIKGSKKYLNQLCTLYQVMKRDTKQLWYAKLYDTTLIKTYKLEECLQYNYTVLGNCKEMENIVHVQEIFIKGGSSFIIQQQHDMTLIEKLKEECPLSSSSAEDVLCDTLSGLFEIYNQRYFTRSLRPEHIVCVDEVWKIQSFVLNANIYNVQCELCWSSKYASPEDRMKENQLPEKMIDEQLVWNLGIIGLYMFLGPQFQYQKITNNEFVPWEKVRSLTSESMYNFLVKALKVDFKQRLKLKDLLQNQMFAHLSNNSNPFLSYQKFYGHDSGGNAITPIEVILYEADLKNFQALKDQIERFKYFGEVEKYLQQLHFKNSFDVSLIRYLCFKIAYENLVKIKQEITAWKRAKPALVSFKPLKELQLDLNTLIDKFRLNKVNYCKNLRGLQITKSQVPEIKNGLDHEINDENIPYYQIVHIFMKVAGCIYTQAAKSCETVENQSKQRTICFYSLAAYLVHFYENQKFEPKKFQSFIKYDTLQLSRLINQAPISLLIELTQKLVKDHFAYIQDK